MIQCRIKYFKDKNSTHISQVLVGFKLLENKGVLKITIDSDSFNFRSRGLYEHNSIVEVTIDDKILVYDMADGYQSIHRKDIFDSQLDRVTYYFKRSYNSQFHQNMKNKRKIKPYGLNYYCTCNRNPYDKFSCNYLSINTIRKFVSHLYSEKKWLKLCNYKNFISNNSYDNYNILFLTRIWDSTNIDKEYIKRIYTYMSDEEALIEANKWKESLDTATKYRINLIRKLKEEFGDKFVGGILKDSFSIKLCPELIVDDSLTNKENFMRIIKENYICITSVGLHDSIGWKFAEYICNARAIISDPLMYEVVGNLKKGKNYLEYRTINECIDNCRFLLNNIEEIHKIEKNNAEYYKNYLAPDKIIVNTIKILDNNLI